MESPWDRGTEVCSNGPGRMTKMAASPYMVKTFKKSSPKSKGRWPWHLVCSIACSSTTKFIKMMTVTYFTARSNLVPRSCMGKMENNGFFRNYCRLRFETGNRWQKRQEVSVDIKTVSPGGCMLTAPGLYTCIKSDLKDISLKLETNGQSDKVFLLTSKFCPLGAVCPCPGTIYMY